MFGIHPNFIQELIIWGSILTVSLILEITIGAFYAHIFVIGSTVTLILSFFNTDFDTQIYVFLSVLLLMLIRLFFSYQKRTKNRPHHEALLLLDSIQNINKYDVETNTYSIDASGFRWEVITTKEHEIDEEVIVVRVKGNRLVVEKK